MLLTWVIVSSVLLFCWLAAVPTAFYINWEENKDVGGDEDWVKYNKMIAGFSFLGFIAAAAWPVVLAAAVPVFLVYGAVQAIKFPFTKPWQNS